MKSLILTARLSQHGLRSMKIDDADDLVSGTAHRLKLTPELIEEAKKGFPLFEAGGLLAGTAAAGIAAKHTGLLDKGENRPL